MNFRRKGEKRLYSFLNDRCIGRKCWAPGMYQHRSPLAGGGSMNTSSPDTPCCMNRAYRGCPAGPDGERQELTEEHGLVTIQGAPDFSKELAEKRKTEGWRAA